MKENLYPIVPCPEDRVTIDDDLCLDYLLGLLADTEEKDFEDHVRVCPACEQIFRIAAGGHAVAEARGERLPGTDVGGQASAKPMGFRFRPFALVSISAMAALLAIMVFGPFGSGDEGGSLSMVPLPGPDTDIVLRSGAPAAVIAHESGLVAYERGDYPSAVSHLSLAVAADSTNLFARVYLGSALSLTGDYAGSIALLEPVDLRRVPSPWDDEVRWILACSWDGMGDNARVDSLLNVLVTKPGLVGDRTRELDRN